MSREPNSPDTPWSAAPFVPDRRDLDSLRPAVRRCRGCPLFEHATQAVFGEGRGRARLMLVGEQPGDAEDREGQPFVGPAGRVLTDALAAAGISRDEVFLTNAVKHFKFERQGKRRLHKKPSAREVDACRPWLEAELEIVRPDVVVALGATAGRALAGRPVRVMSARGAETQLGGHRAVVTIHPSAVLRAADDADELRGLLVEDLRLARRLAATASAPG
jgi:DNA polymerase